MSMEKLVNAKNKSYQPILSLQQLQLTSKLFGILRIARFDGFGVVMLRRICVTLTLAMPFGLYAKRS